MDHSTAFRNKFWFVFFGLFVFWYFLLYGFDWSSLPGLTSISMNVDRPIESLSLTSNVMKEGDIIIKTVNFDDKESERLNVITTAVVPTSSIIQQEKDKKKDTSCKGRYIYVHDLPTRYNEDLLKQCKKFNKWNDLCPYLTNMGLGHELGNPQRMFLNRGWFNTQQFNLEVIFHNRMKQYDCLTNDSSEATAIYVPYYAGLDVARYLWSPFNGSIKDADSLDLMKWLRSKPEWGGRMWGKDHFLVAGRITWDFRRGNDAGDDPGWGNNLMRLPESINMTMLTIESSPWHKNDFAIPYPTYFHPSTYDDVLLWQNKIRKQRRRTLFCFAGAPRPNMVDSIRDEIMSQCQESSSGGRRICKLLECKNDKNKCNKPLYLMKLFQSSVFCLQPSGDSFTRRSTFDSILAGCIPVFFTPASAYVQYLWHLPEKNFSSYSVMISEEDVKNKNVSIEDVLSRIPAKKVSAMREEVIKLIPKVIYADPRSKVHKFKDAFDLTVEGVIKRVKKLKKEMEEGEKFEDFDEESSWKYYTFGTVDEHEWDSFFLRTPRDRY